MKYNNTQPQENQQIDQQSSLGENIQIDQQSSLGENIQIDTKSSSIPIGIPQDIVV